MRFIDLFRQIILSIWTHKIRTCLALFGIIWGTMTVTLLLALGNGFYEKSMQNLAFLKNGTIFAWAGTTSKPYAGIPQGQKIHLEINDFLEIMQNIPGIQWYSPEFADETLFQYQNKETKSLLLGVAPGYETTMQFEIAAGKSRFFNTVDLMQKNRVVYLDAPLRKVLFGTVDPVGKTIFIKHVPFLVIGVADPEKNAGIVFSGSHTGYIPYSTYLAIKGIENINTIFLTPDKIEDSVRIKNNLKNLLAAKLHYDPSDDEAFHMPDLEDKQVFISWFFFIIELFLGFCGALTLSVGGLGVANMMFLIVTERTREIGLRKAIGASEKNILTHFLFETLVLVGLGGMIGT
ncbi:MAG TPA: ABC transporter permease, partial [Gammaproteobacteria bacterium]|nr:ABC transporter permease [Gammaproteobacteria bacterium]